MIAGAGAGARWAWVRGRGAMKKCEGLGNDLFYSRFFKKQVICNCL